MYQNKRSFSHLAESETFYESRRYLLPTPKQRSLLSWTREKRDRHSAPQPRKVLLPTPKDPPLRTPYQRRNEALLPTPSNSFRDSRQEMPTVSESNRSFTARDRKKKDCYSRSGDRHKRSRKLRRSSVPSDTDRRKAVRSRHLPKSSASDRNCKEARSLDREKAPAPSVEPCDDGGSEGDLSSWSIEDECFSEVEDDECLVLDAISSDEEVRETCHSEKQEASGNCGKSDKSLTKRTVDPRVNKMLPDVCTQSNVTSRTPLVSNLHRRSSGNTNVDKSSTMPGSETQGGFIRANPSRPSNDSERNAKVTPRRFGSFEGSKSSVGVVSSTSSRGPQADNRTGERTDTSNFSESLKSHSRAIPDSSNDVGDSNIPETSLESKRRRSHTVADEANTYSDRIAVLKEKINNLVNTRIKSNLSGGIDEISKKNLPPNCIQDTTVNASEGVSTESASLLLASNQVSSTVSNLEDNSSETSEMTEKGKKIVGVTGKNNKIDVDASQSEQMRKEACRSNSILRKVKPSLNDGNRTLHDGTYEEDSVQAIIAKALKRGSLQKEGSVDVPFSACIEPELLKLGIWQEEIGKVRRKGMKRISYLNSSQLEGSVLDFTAENKSVKRNSKQTESSDKLGKSPGGNLKGCSSTEETTIENLNSTTSDPLSNLRREVPNIVAEKSAASKLIITNRKSRPLWEKTAKDLKHIRWNINNNSKKKAHLSESRLPGDNARFRGPRNGKSATVENLTKSTWSQSDEISTTASGRKKNHRKTGLKNELSERFQTSEKGTNKVTRDLKKPHTSEKVNARELLPDLQSSPVSRKPSECLGNKTDLKKGGKSCRSKIKSKEKSVKRLLETSQKNLLSTFRIPKRSPIIIDGGGGEPSRESLNIESPSVSERILDTGVTETDSDSEFQVFKKIRRVRVRAVPSDSDDSSEATLNDSVRERSDSESDETAHHRNLENLRESDVETGTWDSSAVNQHRSLELEKPPTEIGKITDSSSGEYCPATKTTENVNGVKTQRRGCRKRKRKQSRKTHKTSSVSENLEQPKETENQSLSRSCYTSICSTSTTSCDTNVVPLPPKTASIFSCGDERSNHSHCNVSEQPNDGTCDTPPLVSDREPASSSTHSEDDEVVIIGEKINDPTSSSTICIVDVRSLQKTDDWAANGENTSGHKTSVALNAEIVDEFLRSVPGFYETVSNPFGVPETSSCFTSLLDPSAFPSGLSGVHSGIVDLTDTAQTSEHRHDARSDEISLECISSSPALSSQPAIVPAKSSGGLKTTDATYAENKIESIHSVDPRCVICGRNTVSFCSRCYKKCCYQRYYSSCFARHTSECQEEKD